jgi:uncharacterized membrane protein YsdA (DUF1294 family)
MVRIAQILVWVAMASALLAFVLMAIDPKHGRRKW